MKLVLYSIHKVPDVNLKVSVKSLPNVFILSTRAFEDDEKDKQCLGEPKKGR